MNEEQWYVGAWQSMPGVGSQTIRSLVKTFGSAEEAWHASASALCDTDLLDKKAALAVQRQRNNYDWDKAMQQMEQRHVQLVTYWDEEYPALLKHTFNPPAALFYKGTLPQDDKTIAIVGSRKSTPYGSNTAAYLAENLAKAGVTIISGGARGIDTAAHRGSLNGKGKTVAVVANGLDITYPPENDCLFYKIVEQGGAIVSEFPLGMPSLPANFPARNRIISGLSQGVVIVEAAQRSGALITSDFALEEGREVFAVPGSIFSATSAGTHELLKQGAAIATCADDILKQYGWETAEAAPAEEEIQLTLAEVAVLSNIPFDDSIHQEEIILKTRLPFSQVSQIILQLIFKGYIRDLGGRRFIRNKK